MTQHTHTRLTLGCYRCELNLDEITGQAAEDAAKVDAVEELLEQWEAESKARGPQDMLYTSGVVGMLRDALAARASERAER